MASFAENVRDRGGRAARPAAVPRFGVVLGSRAPSGPAATAGVEVRGAPQGFAARHQHAGEGEGAQSPREDQDDRQERGTNSRGQHSVGYGQEQAQEGGRRYRGREQSGPVSRPAPGEQSRRDSGAQDGQRQFHSVHIYGGKAALCFSADETRGQEHTVRVEAAPSKGQRSYEWGEKISLQFTVKELTKVLCVLMGWLPAVEFQAHGVANDKAISMANQDGGKVFVNLRQTRTARAVPVTAEDVFGIMDLVIKQMLKNSPHLTADALLAMTRAMAVRFKGA